MKQHIADTQPYLVRCLLNVRTGYCIPQSDIAATGSSFAIRDTKEKISGVTNWYSESIELCDDYQLVRLTFASNGPADLSALLEAFPQFHLLWRDEQFCGVEQDTGKPICIRFGEAWTTEFTPLWFSNKEHGDRYHDEESGAILVFNRMRHEFLTGDTVFTVGEPDAEYRYGVGMSKAVAPANGEQVAAALAGAVVRGKRR